MTNRPKKRHSDNTWRKPDLRHGYTTSACAAACTVAAMQALTSGQPVERVTIDLPGESGVTFEMARCEFHPDGVLCGTIKDSGDDPDVTHGAEIQCFVAWQDAGITITGGIGIGVATKPGLPVAVGEAAINPGSRRLIQRVVETFDAEALAERGLRVEIRVPEGERLARETLNPRLGILGGISILGTTGVLKPFSTSAYRASIYTELKVTRSNGIARVVLTTGNRSEQYAMQLYPDLPELAFIQVGDHIDFSLKQSQRLGIEAVVISGMIGKMSKLAQGRMQTHVSQGEVDFEFLAEVARNLGADETLAGKIRSANTAHHVQSMLKQAGVSGLEEMLAGMAAQSCLAYAPALREVEVLLFAIGGKLLARKRLEQGT
ncbi:MAG: cobalt-precorrin-5B (C(1))-methyltransferase [Chloroflexota bacterium]